MRIKYNTFTLKFVLRILILLLIDSNWVNAQNVSLLKNLNLPIDERVDNLVSQMTLSEKMSQLFNNSPAIDRLGIPKYNWWNECLHGVARAGKATINDSNNIK